MPEPMEVDGAELTWSINRMRAHSAAIDGLANVCAAIDRRVQAIAEARIL
jgi:hypothetical protein